MSMTEPTIDNATLRKAQILRATVAVIAAQGADRARLKDVAEEAGVSLGLVQHYFRTRQELMAKVFNVMMAISLGSWERIKASQAEPLVALLAGIRLHVYGTVSFGDRWGFWAEFWAVARREPTLTALGTEVYDSWLVPFQSALEELAAQGALNDKLSPREAAVIITGAFDGIAVRTLMSPESMTDEGIDQHMLKLVDLIVLASEDELADALTASVQLFESAAGVMPLSDDLIARTMMVLDH